MKKIVEVKMSEKEDFKRDGITFFLKILEGYEIIEKPVFVSDKKGVFDLYGKYIGYVDKYGFCRNEVKDMIGILVGRYEVPGEWLEVEQPPRELLSCKNTYFNVIQEGKIIFSELNFFTDLKVNKDPSGWSFENVKIRINGRWKPYRMIGTELYDGNDKEVGHLVFMVEKEDLIQYLNSI